MFIPPGDYSLEFRGFLTVDLRAQYTFRAILNGKLQLAINGTEVLNTSSNQASKPFRLNRGTNSVVARYIPPHTGDAQLQLLWSSKSIPHPIPIPSEVLSHDPENAEFRSASGRRAGLRLFQEYRCISCHGPSKADAPEFTNIGARLNADWIADNIASPRHRGMPRLVSREQAESCAAYLATFRNPVQQAPEKGDRSRGKELYRSLHCAVCHDNDLTHVGAKFRPGALSAYLRNPQAYFFDNPMPNFGLTTEEADDLAAFLAPEGMATPSIAGSASIAEGENIIRSAGCLNCHKSPLANNYSAPLKFRSAIGGCLDPNPPAGTPRFQINNEERKQLSAFLETREFEALNRRVPHEIALFESVRLRCAECHDKVEGAPRFSTLGGKLNPDWARRLVAGEIPSKPRPWLTARMPGFPAYARDITEGLAALHGFSPNTPHQVAISSERAALGARLISVAGGFSCVACHAVGNYTSGQVVESPGVNLALSGERLLPSFFHRWVLNPVSMDPSTKMPVYFDADGRSQLIDILEGDGAKQLDAMWQYLRLGPQMPPPPTP
jgi:mono/diheme cytochrome c family protein